MYKFYFFVVMAAPVVMLLVGLWWKISPPPFQSKGPAYSTELTRKEPDAWVMAHRNCSRLWTRIGILSGAASAVLMGLFKENYASLWVWVIVGQMILFCISVFMVELLLKNTFQEEDK